MRLKSFYRGLALLLLAIPLWLSAQSLPSGTTFDARFSAASGSRISHSGDATDATVISPLTWQRNIVIPQGTVVRGTVEQAVALGLGLKHRTARIQYRFTGLELANGQTLSIRAELVKMETAKERVDSNGVVVGVHPGANLSSASGYYTLPLMLANPAWGLPFWGVKSLIAPSTSPEIYFPAGTEFVLRLIQPLDISGLPLASPAISSFSVEEIADFRKQLRSSHACARSGKQLSDQVNLVMVGTRQEIHRAFESAGWVTAEGRSPLALYRMYNALTKRVGYRRAPMKVLSLNGKLADFVYQKSLNDVAARHHARFWRVSSESNVWFGTATEDVALCFRRMHWTHRINPKIDSERAKIVNDLAYTGCVDSASLLRREPSRVPSVTTDGAIALLQFNGCEHPKVMPGVEAQNASRPERWLPRVMTSLRDDVIRANPLFSAYNTVRSLAGKAGLHATEHGVSTAEMIPRLDWVRGPQRAEAGTN